MNDLLTLVVFGILICKIVSDELRWKIHKAEHDRRD